MAAQTKVCADGGACRLLNNIVSMVQKDPATASETADNVQRRHIPDVIIGDLDSINPRTRQYYSDLGVPFVDLSHDQDTTDFTKCVSHVEQMLKNSGQHAFEDHTILALGALGGRLDHTLSNLNTLHMFPHLDIVLWGDGNLVRLIPPGKTCIRCDREQEGPACGLVPMGRAATASSSGLKWNLDKTEMVFGGLISTCNVLVDDVVTVETDGPLLWMTEVHPK